MLSVEGHIQAGSHSLPVSLVVLIIVIATLSQMWPSVGKAPSCFLIPRLLKPLLQQYARIQVPVPKVPLTSQGTYHLHLPSHHLRETLSLCPHPQLVGLSHPSKNHPKNTHMLLISLPCQPGDRQNYTTEPSVVVHTIPSLLETEVEGSPLVWGQVDLQNETVSKN